MGRGVLRDSLISVSLPVWSALAISPPFSFRPSHTISLFRFGTDPILMQYRMPSPAAWARGQEAARKILDAHVANTGSFPETVAVSSMLDGTRSRGIDNLYRCVLRATVSHRES